MFWGARLLSEELIVDSVRKKDLGVSQFEVRNPSSFSLLPHLCLQTPE